MIFLNNFHSVEMHMNKQKNVYVYKRSIIIYKCIFEIEGHCRQLVCITSSH